MSSSPKNLRKFLDSNDSGLVRMGLSMAKGMGVSDEMLMEILWMYMFHDDKTVRAAAKSTFIKLAPVDAKQVVKENWKASYRTDFISSDYYGRKSNQYGHKLGILGKALCQTSLGQIVEDDSPELHKFIESDDPAMRRMGMSMAKGSGVPVVLYRKIFSISLWDIEEENREFAGELIKEIGLEKIPEFPFVQWLTKVIKIKDIDARRNSAQALETIGDVRAVEPLIKALKDSVNDVRQASAKALETIGDVRAVEPLIKLLERPSSRESAAQALGTMSDERAIEPLIMALRDKNGKFSPASAKALVQFRDSAMDFLIAKLEDAILSDSVAEILEKLGKPAVKPLIKILNGGSSKARNTAVETLGNIGDKVAVKPVIEVLGDKDKKLRFNAVEALGKIEDELAVKPLIAILRDSDRSVRLSAAEALISSDWSEKKDEICKSIIEVFEDDWVLAGLVIWSGCDSSEILHKSILELFNLSDNEDIIPIVFDEILLNYWKNVSVSKNFIRRSSGSYRVGGGVLDICKRKTTCRGSVNFTSKLFPTSIRRGKKCKEMTKGDLRLGVELPNPNNPQYLTTYYYCASCVSTYLNIQKRYDIMEKWWPQTLKAAQVANQRKIKEQETEQAAKKRTEKNKEIMKTLGPLTYLSEIFLESGDSEMKNLGLTIKKTGFSEEMLSTFLRLYLWDDDATIRNAARSVFFSNASKTLQAIVKKSWQVRYRTMATFNGPEPQRFVAGFPNRAKANAIEQFIKAINDSHGLRPTEYICVEAVLYPMLKSLTDQKTAYSGSLLFSGYNSDKYGIIPVVSANLKLLKKVEKEQIVNVASRIFARFMRPFEWRKLYGKNITIKTVELVACVAFYAACGLKGIKVTLAEISVHSKYSQAEISETYKLMKKKKNILNNDFPNVPIGWEW